MSFRGLISKSSLILYTLAFLLGQVHLRAWVEPSIPLCYKTAISLLSLALICLLTIIDQIKESWELQTDKALLLR